MAETRQPRIKWAREWLKTTKSLYINGEWVEGHGPVLESISPINGEVIGHIRCADKEDIDLAAKAARTAFDNGSWTRDVNHRERRKIMQKIAATLMDHIEEIATIETLDNGKLFTESCEDVTNVADFFDYYAGWTDKIYGETNPVLGDFFSYTRREPVGVCGQIIPWNYPMDMAGFKLAPALACANTLIIKPSSMTSLSLVRTFELIDELDIMPKGVMNLILATGSMGSAAARIESSCRLFQKPL